MTQGQTEVTGQNPDGPVVDKIFNDDEMRLLNVKPEWTEEEMLNQEGIFFLKDVAQKLQVHSSEFKKEARALEKSGQNPWGYHGYPQNLDPLAGPYEEVCSLLQST